MSDIPVWARVGAKVVCINGQFKWSSKPRFSLWLATMVGGEVRKGGIYVITSVEPDGPIVWLRLKGYAAPYTCRAFRPLISQADDLAAHFHQLLQVPHRIEEKA